MGPKEHDGHNDDPQLAADGHPPDGALTPDPVPAAPSAAPASPKRSREISRTRLVGVDVLIGVTTLLLVVGMFAVWFNRLLFSPDNWSKTSTQLLENPDIRGSTANYLVDQLYANVNVAGVLKQGLPPQLQPLAAPAAGALRSGAVSGVELALSRPLVQNLWARANRRADQAFIAIVEGGNGHVGINNGVVTLNLKAVLADAAARLGLPGTLVAKLPPQAANLTVFKSDKLSLIEKVGKAIKGLALWLTILVPVLYGVAILLARGHRRRTLMTVGFAGLFAGVVVLLGRSVLETQITNALASDESVRPAISATIAIGTAILSQVGAAVIFGAILLVAAAWFAGPARVARTSREAIAPFLRERPGASYAVTVGALVVLFIWDPIHATGTPAGMLVFTLMALFGTELLRRQTAWEFPEARPGAAKQVIRAQMTSVRERSKAPSPATTATTAEQLTQLAELRDRGAISPDEYQSAKAALLHR